jgi:DNA-binding HxlR family transcriptional regulator
MQAANCERRLCSRSMRHESRSGCPINLTLEMLGDRWSLIVIRDIMFGNRRHYGELLRLSEEGIASNILADRLARLRGKGLLSRTSDPTHKQKAIYSLTEVSIQLVPLLAHMGAWGRRHTRVSKELSVRARLLEEGGERMWKAFGRTKEHSSRSGPASKVSVRRTSGCLRGGCQTGSQGCQIAAATLIRVSPSWSLRFRMYMLRTPWGQGWLV